MENFDWKMVFEAISTLTKALPKDEKVRKWVVIGCVAVIAAAAVASSQAASRKSLPGQ